MEPYARNYTNLCENVPLAVCVPIVEDDRRTIIEDDKQINSKSVISILLVLVESRESARLTISVSPLGGPVDFRFFVYVLLGKDWFVTVFSPSVCVENWAFTKKHYLPSVPFGRRILDEFSVHPADSRLYASLRCRADLIGPT